MQRNFLTKSLMIAVLAIGSVQQGLAADANTLTVDVAQDAGSWDPIDTYLVNWSVVANSIFDGLTARGADLKLRPALATSWEYTDNDKSLVFHLRKGVTFQNGEPFDANAVKFTFERLLADKTSPQRANYTSIDSVEIIDPYTVKFHLQNPDPTLLTKLAGYGGMIVPPKYIEEKGDAYFNTHPIGTGPYQVVAYQPNISVTLKRYDGFWGPKAKVENVVNRFVKEPATQVADLQSGRADIITLVPIALLDKISSNKNLEVISKEGPTTYSLRFNTKDGITKNLDVRKALIMAVDRQAIINSILQGQAKPIVSFQSSLSFGYDPDLEGLPFDQKAAQSLLKKAGVKPGTKVEIDFRGNNSTFREVAQAVAGYLSMVGIQATIKPYDSNEYINNIVPQGKTGEMFQQSWGGWTFDYDNTAYLLYHSGEHNNPYDKSEQVDKWLEAERSMVDPEKRLPILRDIGKYIADQHWEMPLYSLNTIYAINKRVEGFGAPSDMRLRLNSVSLK